MTQGRFNEIIRNCETEVPNFIRKAIWGFKECEESNSIEINVAFTRKVTISNKDIETHFFGKSLTQKEENHIICAIMALNEHLL